MQTTTTYIALISALSFSAAAQQASIQAPQSATANDFIEVFKQLSGEHPAYVKVTPKVFAHLAHLNPPQPHKRALIPPYSAIKRRLRCAFPWAEVIQMQMRRQTHRAAWQWCLI